MLFVVFILFFFLSKSNELQTNCLSQMISHGELCSIWRNSGGRVRFQKIKNSQSFENLNDADIVSMPMFATCITKMEQIVLFMRNCFSTTNSQRSSVSISHGSENFDFCC